MKVVNEARRIILNFLFIKTEATVFYLFFELLNSCGFVSEHPFQPDIIFYYEPAMFVFSWVVFDLESNERFGLVF